MAGVQKRIKNGTVRWYARWRDADGNPHSKVFDRRTDALRHGQQMEEAARERVPDPADVTVGQWLDRWLDDYVAPRAAAGRIRPRTAEGYEGSVRNHLMPTFGDLQLVDLRVSDVDQWMTGLLAAGYKPRSVRQYRAALSGALTAAQREELVARNVAQLAEPPEVERRDVSVFTPDEFAAIIVAADDHRLGSAVLFGAATGLRRSEIVALKWADVDLDAGQFKVRRTRHRVSKAAARVTTPGVIESSTKNTTSWRTVGIAPEVDRLLRRHKADQAAERLAATTWIGCDHVWTTGRGTPLEGRQLARALTQILEAAGVERTGQRVHELRRTWTTYLSEAGVPPEVIQRLGGWASMDVPNEAYTHVAQRRLADGAATAARRLNGRPR